MLLCYSSNDQNNNATILGKSKVRSMYLPTFTDHAADHHYKTRSRSDGVSEINAINKVQMTESEIGQFAKSQGDKVTHRLHLRDKVGTKKFS